MGALLGPRLRLLDWIKELFRYIFRRNETVHRLTTAPAAWIEITEKRSDAIRRRDFEAYRAFIEHFTNDEAHITITAAEDVILEGHMLSSERAAARTSVFNIAKSS